MQLFYKNYCQIHLACNFPKPDWVCGLLLLWIITAHMEATYKWLPRPSLSQCEKEDSVSKILNMD